MPGLGETPGAAHIGPNAAPPPNDEAEDVAEDVAEEPERGPLRRCIVTRAQGPREAMLRFVVAPSGMVVPDLSARLPGRGMWLSARADVLGSPRTRQAFSRAARARVDVPDDLAWRLEEGLRARIADLLGFARRAGQAVAGFQKAHEWVVAGRAALIIAASDGSLAERARFAGARFGEDRGVPVLSPLSSAALGVVFGRERTVHVAVSAGRLAAALHNEDGRLAGVRGDAVEGSGGVMAPARDEDSDGR